MFISYSFIHSFRQSLWHTDSSGPLRRLAGMTAAMCLPLKGLTYSYDSVYQYASGYSTKVFLKTKVCNGYQAFSIFMGRSNGDDIVFCRGLCHEWPTNGMITHTSQVTMLNHVITNISKIMKQIALPDVLSWCPETSVDISYLESEWWARKSLNSVQPFTTRNDKYTTYNHCNKCTHCFQLYATIRSNSLAISILLSTVMLQHTSVRTN